MIPTTQDEVVTTTPDNVDLTPTNEFENLQEVDPIPSIAKETGSTAIETINALSKFPEMAVLNQENPLDVPKASTGTVEDVGDVVMEEVLLKNKPLNIPRAKENIIKDQNHESTEEDTNDMVEIIESIKEPSGHVPPSDPTAEEPMESESVDKNKSAELDDCVKSANSADNLGVVKSVDISVETITSIEDYEIEEATKSDVESDNENVKKDKENDINSKENVINDKEDIINSKENVINSNENVMNVNENVKNSKENVKNVTNSESDMNKCGEPSDVGQSVDEKEETEIADTIVEDKLPNETSKDDTDGVKNDIVCTEEESEFSIQLDCAQG